MIASHVNEKMGLLDILVRLDPSSLLVSARKNLGISYKIPEYELEPIVEGERVFGHNLVARRGNADKSVLRDSIKYFELVEADVCDAFVSRLEVFFDLRRIKFLERKFSSQQEIARELGISRTSFTKIKTKQRLTRSTREIFRKKFEGELDSPPTDIAVGDAFISGMLRCAKLLVKNKPAPVNRVSDEHLYILATLATDKAWSTRIVHSTLASITQYIEDVTSCLQFPANPYRVLADWMDWWAILVFTRRFLDDEIPTAINSLVPKQKRKF
ncbi:MAG: hypothetical protein AAFN77_24305 [Planctomycetota bacterium]